MADIQTWGDLPKDQTDPQTIDEAIENALDVHNDDSEAHMASLASLATHRENPIADHPEESVVNDKMAVRSRAYVAIVDPASDTDFSTVQAAHDYAVTKGGGTILIVPGDHYIVDDFEISPLVNFEGIDPDTCNIHAGYTGGDYCYYAQSGWSGKPTSTWYNLGLVDEGGGFFHAPPSGDPAEIYTRFEFCKMSGDGQYLMDVSTDMYISKCVIELSTAGALSCVRYMTLTENFITAPDGAGDGKLFHASSGWYENWVDFFNNQGDESSDEEIDYFPPGGGSGKIISGNKFWKCANNAVGFNGQAVSGNFFEGTFSANFTISGTGNAIVGNVFSVSSSNQIILDSGGSDNVFAGNNSGADVDDDGSNNLVLHNAPENNFTSLSSSATAMALRRHHLVQLTPNSTRTLTTTVPPAGSRRTIKILTSGTSSYTLTFGTGFKAVGTLATGVTSSRIFIINFISDGSNLIEVSRTSAIVA